jgi:hypothetical protein
MGTAVNLGVTFFPFFFKKVTDTPALPMMRPHRMNPRRYRLVLSNSSGYKIIAVSGNGML